LRKLGVHVSIAGKIYDSFDRAKSLGCTAMQIFSRSPRQFRRTNLSSQDIKKFKKKASLTKIKPVVVHIPYTLNLVASKDKFHNITIRDFTSDLIEAGKLGVDYLVTHMGSFKGSTEEEGLMRVVKAFKTILGDSPGCRTKILLENTSGSGHWLGYKFSHIRFILQKLRWPKRLGLCLDTAHAWAAGYNINCDSGVNDMISEIDDQVGLDRLGVIHLNDTQEKLGSRRDRHFHIARGSIGKKGFPPAGHCSFKNRQVLLFHILRRQLQQQCSGFRYICLL